MSSSTAKRTAFAFPILVVAASIAAACGSGCGAPMRPFPDEISPLPRSAVATMGDAGVIHREAGGELALAVHHEHVEKCALRVRHNAVDHAIVSRGLVSAFREFRSPSGISEELDATGIARGLRIDALEEGSCLAALGFEEGDVVLEINGYALGPVLTRRQGFESIDDSDTVFAVVHFQRGTQIIDWRFDEIH
ncbi:hypothetical protein BH09MYX1_BH09MYX1_17530 [soil metagenome]